ncbi:MAG: HAD family phosphatase [Flavobacteriales bacterium]|nr:HAD family phosphatase [Flavobacteriales bacterium]MDW8431429.1 HAD family phosphatase [Flavobacteriales bacterium]
MTSSPIQALLLDLGGVILDIHYDRTLQAFRNLGFHEIEKWYDGYRQTGIFDDFEEGRLSSEAFLDTLSQYCPQAQKQQILEAWNAMLGRVPPWHVQGLQTLRKSLPVYLFSNTNDLHYRQFQKDFRADFGFDLSDLFEIPFYSHLLGLRKPKTEAFQKVASLAGIRPEATLFMDDNPGHIAGAQKAGFQTYWLDPASGRNFLDILAEMGIGLQKK